MNVLLNEDKVGDILTNEVISQDVLDVVGWLDLHCWVHTPFIGLVNFRRECPACWQELKNHLKALEVKSV